MRKFFLFSAVLNLFDGAAGAAGAAGGDGTGAAAEGAAQGETNGIPGTTRRGRSGALSNVVYGKQPEGVESPAAGENRQTNERPVTSSTQDERRQRYNEVRNGEFKDMFDEEFQGILNRRFKDFKGDRAALDAQKPIMDMLQQRYGTKEGDVQGLMQALENDDAYWSEAADEAGLSVQQYKEFQRLQRQNAALMEQQKAREGQEKANAQLQSWYQEAESVRQKYPTFDLNAEVKNPEFLSMLRSGVPMDHAYMVMHMEDIVNGVAQNTAQQTQKQVVQHIRARGARPAENGTSAQSAFTVKSDVTKLTKADRAEIARRAARGEKITF